MSVTPSDVAITAGTGTNISTFDVTNGGGTDKRQAVAIAGPNLGDLSVAANVTATSDLQTATPELTSAISLTAASTSTVLAVVGRTTFSVSISSLGTGGIVFAEVSIDGGTQYSAVPVWDSTNNLWTINSGIPAGPLCFFQAMGAVTHIRIFCSVLTSGTVTGRLTAGVQQQNIPPQVGAMATAIPPVAALMGGTDGTNLRALAVSTTGQPQVVIQPATTGGLSMAAGTTGTTKVAIKASAGQLFGYHIGNSNTSPVYVQIFNVASGSVTLGTNTPDISLFIPAGGGATFSSELGIAFGTAITLAATTTRTGNTAPTNTVDYNIFYK